MTLTGSLLGFAVGQLVVGPLSDSFGRRLPLLSGLALFVVASLAAAATPTVEVLIAMRVLQGFGVAGAAVIALAIVNDLFDGVGAARLISRLILVLGVAPVFAPSIGSYMLQITSWRGVFVLLASLGAALLVVGLVRLPETLPTERRRAAGVRTSTRTYRVLLGDRAMVGLMLTAGLSISTLFSYIAGAPFILQELYELDTQQFALAFAALGAALVVGTQITGQLVTRIAPEKLLVAGLSGALGASMLLAALVVTTTGGLPGLLLALLATALFVGVALPTAPAMVLARHGWAAGSASALLGFTRFGIAGLCAPPGVRPPRTARRPHDGCGHDERHDARSGGLPHRRTTGHQHAAGPPPQQRRQTDSKDGAIAKTRASAPQARLPTNSHEQRNKMTKLCLHAAWLPAFADCHGPAMTLTADRVEAPA